MSRHRGLKYEVEEAYEEEEQGENFDDYDEGYLLKTSYYNKIIYATIETQVYEILDEVGEEFEYEDVQRLLEKFDYDSDKIIQYLLKNKG